MDLVMDLHWLGTCLEVSVLVDEISLYKDLVKESHTVERYMYGWLCFKRVDETSLYADLVLESHTVERHVWMIVF